MEAAERETFAKCAMAYVGIQSCILLWTLSFSLWDCHALKLPGLQTGWDGWTAGDPAAATPVCTAGSPVRERSQHLAKIPQTFADNHKVKNAMTASLLGLGTDSMMDLWHYLII